MKAIAPKLYVDATLYAKWCGDISGIPRPTILYLKALMCSQPLTGVEIGVLQAANAVSILDTLNIKQLYLIDPYLDYIQGTHLFRAGMNRDIADRKLKPYTSKTVRLFMTANEAVEHVPSNLDFVYIDGNHDYACVKSDIANYYPKVRGGGVIGGHDFTNDYEGVVRAVCEFIVGANQTLLHDNLDWWIIKR